MSRTFQFVEVDVAALLALKDAVNATGNQMIMAYNRALSRTAKELHRMSVAMVMSELAVKSKKVLKKRVEPFIKRRSKALEKTGDLTSAKIWYGLNALKVHDLKGTLKNPRKVKQARDPESGRFIKGKRAVQGATFTPKGKALSATTYPNSFAAVRYGSRSIWIRNEGGGITEARVEISDQLQDAIDETIADNILPIFMKHYEQDLRGRVKGNVHVDNKTRRRI